MAKFNEIVVDVRELEAPQPLMEVMEALKQLDENSYIKILHRISPCRVYDLVKEKGLCQKTLEKQEGVVMYIYQPHQKEDLWFLQD